MKERSYKVTLNSPERVEIVAEKRQPILVRVFLSMMAGACALLALYVLIIEKVPFPIGVLSIGPVIFFLTILIKGRAKKEIIHLDENEWVIEKWIGKDISKHSYKVENITQLRPTFDPRTDLPVFTEFRNTMWNMPDGRITFNYEEDRDIKFAAVIEHEDAPFLIRDIKRFYAAREIDFV